MTSATPGNDAGRLLAPLAPYARPDVKRSVWQIVNTLVPYVAIWVLMVKLLPVSFWWTLLLAPIGGGLLIRTFILFHDCGHGSFFRQRWANELVGYVTGIITLTPPHAWWREHAIHHATAGDLDRRDVGDIWTLTVDEYMAASRWKRLGYRFFRFPPVMFILGPILSFVVRNRLVRPTSGPREARSVHLTNLGIAIAVTILCLTIGWDRYLIVHGLIFAFGAPVGVWLFYVQHNYEGVYWRRHDEWEYAKVGLEGSSYYKLPRVLQWFTGNIGFHHVHHLGPRIPNYFLEKCHREQPIFRSVPEISLLGSLHCMKFRLWDEAQGKMVGFSRVRELHRTAAPPRPTGSTASASA